MKRKIAVALVSVLVCLCRLALAQEGKARASGKPPAKKEVLTNAKVVALIKADLGEEITIAKIQQAEEVKFDLTTDGLIQLKKDGVPQSVIAAMMRRSTPEQAVAEGGKDTSTRKAETKAPESGSATATAAATSSAEPEKTGKMAWVKGRVKSALHRETEEEERQQEAGEQKQGVAAIGRDTNDDCVRNFKKEGSFFTGYSFSSFADVPGVTTSKAFDLLLPGLASRGYQIVNSNKEAGVISMSQAVISTAGKTIPFNMIVRKTTGGVKLEAKVQLTGGQAAPSASVQKEFCEIFDIVRK